MLQRMCSSLATSIKAENRGMSRSTFEQGLVSNNHDEPPSFEPYQRASWCLPYDLQG